MKIIKKIAISIAMIIPVPFIIYLVSTNVMMARWTFLIAVVIIALPFIWVEKRIIKGNITSIELKTVSDFGDPMDTIATLNKKDTDVIAKMFDRRAKLFFDDDFEYCGYAFYIYADKPVILYPQKNNMKYIKINENTWAADLSSQEAEELDRLISRYD